jgi:nucleotide-binding universal stress UspA family protein
MKTIFAAIDLDSDVENILDAAKELARVFDSELILATVEKELPGTEGAEDELVKDELTDAYGDDVHELHKRAKNVAAEGIDCRAVILEGTTAGQIVHAADELNADLIVIGNHGHSPIYDTLVGGAAPGVVHLAKQKVLLVPVED